MHDSWTLRSPKVSLSPETGYWKGRFLLASNLLERLSRLTLPRRSLSGVRVASALLLFVTSCLVSCAPEEVAVDPVEEAAAVEPVTAHNTLTQAEMEEGWQLLFDGETLDGWRGYQMEETPAGWSVADGAIHFVPPSEEEVAAGARRADLITESTWSDFELALEWAISSGGNSGIFFHVTEDHDRAYFSGPEMQVLDDALHRDGQNPLTSAGSNYALHAPSEYPKRAVGDFNEVRLVVEGGHVEHYLNGEKVLEYDLGSPEWEELVAASKFAQWPAYGKAGVGHLALQDHDDEVWYRNLRVRDLSAKDGGADTP